MKDNLDFNQNSNNKNDKGKKRMKNSNYFKNRLNNKSIKLSYIKINKKTTELIIKKSNDKLLNLIFMLLLLPL